MNIRTKYIKQENAREISKKYCEDFNIKQCNIYFVDYLDFSVYGEYIDVYPGYILILDRIENRNPIGILAHELNHHLQYQKYYEKCSSIHGYNWRLAKRKTIRWFENNISPTKDWSLPLKAYLTEDDMKTFRL